jgi:hypothetical protein
MLIAADIEQQYWIWKGTEIGNRVVRQSKGKFRKNANKLEADTVVNTIAEQTGITTALWRLSFIDHNSVPCILL